MRAALMAFGLAILQCMPSSANASGEEAGALVLAQAPIPTPTLPRSPLQPVQSPSPILFSNGIASELTSLNLPPIRQIPFEVPAGLETFTAVSAVDDTQAVGEMVCEAGSKQMSELTAEESAVRLSLKVTCPQARLFAQPVMSLQSQNSPSSQTPILTQVAPPSLPPPNAHFWRVSYLKPNIARTFSITTGLRIGPLTQLRLMPQTSLPSAGLPRPTSSRDEAEMSACINAFKRYKNDPQTGAFVVTFFRRAYHCQTARSLAGLVAQRSNAVLRNDFGRFLTPVGPAWLETPQLVFQIGPQYHRPIDPDHPYYELLFAETQAFSFQSKLNPFNDPAYHVCNLECRPNEDLAGNPYPGQHCTDKLGNQCNPAVPWTPTATVPRPGQVLRFATQRVGTFPVQLQVVSSVPGTLAPEAPFGTRAPSYQPPNPCDNWSAPANLVYSATMSAISHEPGDAGLGPLPSQMSKIQWPLILARSPHVAELQLNAQDLIDGHLVPLISATSSQQHHDFDFYLRVVPLASPGPQCSGTPTNWIRMSLHDGYWAELANAQEAIAAETQREAEDTLYDNVVGENGQKGSPIFIEYAGFSHPAGEFTNFYESLPGYVTRPEGVPAQWASSWGRKFNNDWPGGCSFSPWDVLAWPTQMNDNETFWETAWDDVVNVFDDYDKVFDLMKGFVVDALAYSVTGGQCAIDPLQENAASQSAACTDLKTGLRVVEGVAMAYAGLPPQLPLASAIVNAGKGEVDAAVASAINDASALFASNIAQGVANQTGDQTGLVFAAVKSGGLYAGQSLGDYTKGLIDKSVDKVTTAFTCAETGDSETLRNNEPQYSSLLASIGPDPGNNLQMVAYLGGHSDMKALVGKYGYYLALDSRGCLSVATSPFTWGTPDALLSIHPAILWLRVSKNPGSKAPRPNNVFVKIRETTRLTDDPQFGVGIFEGAAATVSMDAIEHAPEGKLLVPLVLSSNFQAFMNQPSTLNDFGAHEQSLAEGQWREAISGPHPNFSFEAEWTYRWTTLPLKTRSDTAASTAPVGIGPLRNDYGAGVHAPAACNVHGD